VGDKNKDDEEDDNDSNSGKENDDDDDGEKTDSAVTKAKLTMKDALDFVTTIFS
jgi:hypothetical protein